MKPQIAPAESAVFQMLQGLWIAHIVSVLAKLQIPDLVAAGPQSSLELAQKTGADPHCLYRLLRTAAALGLLTEDGEGRFRPSALSDLLRSEATLSLQGIATFFSDPWHTRAWEHLLDVVRTGRPAMDLVYGVSLFEYFGQHPEQASHFFRGMTNFSSLEGPAVAEAYDFTCFEKVCDVGGGHGLLLALILQRSPGVRGLLFDQPSVIEEARQQSFFHDLGSRVEFASGDMFELVPAGMDAYVLKRIVHDWPDAECVELLRHCRKGVNAGGKLLVVEQVILADEASVAAKLMDLEMMVLVGGKEREEAEFQRLLAEAGWQLTRILPTQSAMFIIEGEPIESAG
jgi:O-methyltransferase domain/Dimerisation domain